MAVLINKALIEIPPKFAGRAPINPEYRSRAVKSGEWTGAKGLAEDVRYYGKWMRDEAERRIGHLYPKAKLPDGGEATVIAWLWARTVECPNPACGAQMPLVRSFVLSSKKGKEVYAEPVIDNSQKPPQISFEIKSGTGARAEGTVGRKGAHCVACESPVTLGHIRAEGRARRMGAQLMAVVAEGDRGRVYLAPTPEHETTAAQAEPKNVPETDLPEQALGFRVQLYGMVKHRDLFTNRQLVALTTFSNLVQETRDKVLQDVLDNLQGSERIESSNVREYANAVAMYLGIGVSKLADYNCSNVTWSQSRDQAAHAFTRQAIPMVWDFAEVGPFAGAAGDLVVSLKGISNIIGRLLFANHGIAVQQDVQLLPKEKAAVVISTDPPYYDNIGYSDLSDFFYVWLRHALSEIYPENFDMLLTPKSQELVFTPHRFGGDKNEAKQFFEKGLGQAFVRMRDTAHPDFPLTVYYAFKQTESEGADEVRAYACRTLRR